jgi:hypothetical protein
MRANSRPGPSQALEALVIEHAPQREADPQAKSPLERAFRTVKSAAAALLALTNRLATALPTLCDPELGKSATRILLTCLLRTYQAGARATRTALEPRDGLDLETLTRAAEASREQARATERSRRLLLDHIHGCYLCPHCGLWRWAGGTLPHRLPSSPEAHLALLLPLPRWRVGGGRGTATSPE